jgi:ferrous iron transport protein A
MASDRRHRKGSIAARHSALQCESFSSFGCGVRRLDQLASGESALVVAVDDAAPRDAIARRLRDLGFVAGEPIQLVTRGPFGGEPLLVAIGGTRFALRVGEAARVRVETAGRM